MRRLILTITLIFTAGPLYAGVPAMINYQGHLTDNAGEPVSDGTYSVVFSIYDIVTGGIPLWTETQDVATNGGLFAVRLGSINPLHDSVFSEPLRYLGIAVDGDPELSPNMKLVTVPFSFRTNTADSAYKSAVAGFASQALHADTTNWSGIKDMPAGFADGVDDNSGGDITAVSPGSGLSGGGDAGDVTLEIPAGGITSEHLATNSVVGGAGGDIADNTITSADILNGTITGSDIADNSVFSTNIRDEPGVAQAATTTFINLNVDFQVLSLLSRGLTAPTSGYVLAIATFEASLVYVSGSPSSIDFGLSTSPTSFPVGGSVSWGMSSGMPSVTLRKVITVSRIFSVDPGLTTFHLLGRKIQGGSYRVNERSLSLAFFPTAYGTVTVSSPASPNNIGEH